jgi:hypothetical protein
MSKGMSKQEKAIIISIEEARTAIRAARKQARQNKSQPQCAGVRNEAFNRWLKETRPETYKKSG